LTLKLLDILNNTKDLIVDIGGKNYLISSDDGYLDHIKNGFEPDMVRLFKILISDSNVTLDIGANIGCTAILFGDLSKTVHAFEPSPTTFSLLKNNISKSGNQNIILHNIGLGSEPEETTLTFSPSNRSGGFVSNRTQACEGHKVEKIIIRKLDEIVETLRIQHIDFIKIDVEGFESHVLKGAFQTLSSQHPLVVLELNHWCLNAFQRISIPDFFDFLRSIFPILLAVDKNNYMDLHDEDDSYIVMYHHIVHMRFPNIVACFHDIQLAQFKSHYSHGI